MRGFTVLSLATMAAMDATALAVKRVLVTGANKGIGKVGIRDEQYAYASSIS
jgi:hypothetical protein